MALSGIYKIKDWKNLSFVYLLFILIILYTTKT